MKNDYDANQYLIETAKLRAVDEPDPLEQTQRMPVNERRYRQFEARVMNGPTRDFRDGRREHRLTAHEVAQQDGFPNDA
jgi:hypothetical protein